MAAIRDWESAWAPYDEDTYQFVIDRIGPDDVVLDIGAGDLRLARRLALRAGRVYAIERDAGVLAQANRAGWPDNLIAVRADALAWPFPPAVTVGVLLMRHCTPDHFAEYARRLRKLGCQRLIRNASWKRDVETVDLRSSECYDPDRVGWYACQCGAVGFPAGDPQQISDQLLWAVTEVTSCPKCMSSAGGSRRDPATPRIVYGRHRLGLT